jgi:hypothetical protein
MLAAKSDSKELSEKLATKIIPDRTPTPIKNIAATICRFNIENP